MADRAEKVTERDELIAVLWSKVAHSITSADRSDRTVERPIDAAKYVVNMLTVHELNLLANLAVTFAREQVERLIEDRDEHERVTQGDVSDIEEGSEFDGPNPI